MRRRGTIHLSAGVLVGIVFLLLIVSLGTLMARRGHEQQKKETAQFSAQVRSQLMSANPVAKACSMWFSQGLGMPTAINYYKVPESSKYAQWGCCDDLIDLEASQLDGKRVAKCMKSCGIVLSLLERCSQDYDIMDKGYENAQICYRTRFATDAGCA